MVKVTPATVLHHQVCKAFILKLCLQFDNVLTIQQAVQLLDFPLQLGYSLVPRLLRPSFGHDLHCNLLTRSSVNS